MIVTVLINFHKQYAPLNWLREFEKMSMGMMYYIIQDKFRDNMTEDEIKKRNIVYLSENLENELLSNYEDDVELAFDSSKNTIELLKKFFLNELTKLSIKEEITVVYALFKNMSLEMACREIGLNLKYIEVTALRKENYYKFSLCWFLDKGVIESIEEGRKRYKEFISEKTRCLLKEPISSMELLLMGAKDKISIYNTCMNNITKYDIGVALPTGYREFNGEWTIDKILRETKKICNKNSVVYRMHPAGEIEEIIRRDRDYSINSLEFISKCDTIVSAGSNISFEAMLLGKKVIDFLDFVYADRINTKYDLEKENTYDDLYINFLYFSIYVPFDLLCDEEYIKWRCRENPREVDIFNLHLKFICENYLKVNLEDFCDKNKRMELIWDTEERIENVRDKTLNVLSKFSEITWRGKRVIVCGCGRDASIVRSIVENFGGEVYEYLITENKKKFNMYDGKPVVLWGENEYTEEDIFIISQRSFNTQKEVLQFLINKEVKNIICI